MGEYSSRDPQRHRIYGRDVTRNNHDFSQQLALSSKRNKQDTAKERAMAPAVVPEARARRNKYRRDNYRRSFHLSRSRSHSMISSRHNCSIISEHLIYRERFKPHTCIINKLRLMQTQRAYRPRVGPGVHNTHDTNSHTNR